MYYIVEESGREVKDMVRYSICTSEEQMSAIIDASDFTFADSYGPMTKAEVFEWMANNVATPQL